MACSNFHLPVWLIAPFIFGAFAAKDLSEQCGSDGPSVGSDSSHGIDVAGEHLSLVQKRASAQFAGEARKLSTQETARNAWDDQLPPRSSHFFPLSAARPVIKIKAYYVNMRQSVERASCMEWQLLRAQDKFRRMGIYLEFNRWPAVTFSSCATVKECAQEHPTCFPTGNWTAITHPSLNSDDNVTLLMRGVIGNWCSHLEIVREFEEDSAEWDYFLAFEDDVILTSDFESSLYSLLDNVPPLWTLAAFDTFSNGFMPTDVPEDRLTDSGLELFSISGVKGQYWGAQAWLISAARVQSFAEWYMSLPTMALDWVPKAPRPMDAGFLAYNPGTALQRRFLSDDVAKALPEACHNQSISDIRATSQDQSQMVTLKESVNLMEEEPNRQPREVIVLGMYETGSSFMIDLIRENLEKPNGVRLCHNISAGAHCGGVWQHTHPNRIQELPEVLRNVRGKANLGGLNEAIAVVVVRHPFSLMRSLQKRHHDMNCGDTTEWGWLKKPCSYEANQDDKAAQQDTPRLPKATCHSEDAGEPCWKSLVSSWNSYSYDYLYSIQTLFHKVILVRYEDMLRNARPVLEQIAFSANVSLPATVQHMSNLLTQEGDSQDGDSSDSIEGALQQLASDDYMAKYTDNETQDLCEQLNLPVVYTFGYHACRPVDHKIVQVVDPDADVEMDKFGRPMYEQQQNLSSSGDEQQQQGDQPQQNQGEQQQQNQNEQQQQYQDDQQHLEQQQNQSVQQQNQSVQQQQPQNLFSSGDVSQQQDNHPQQDEGDQQQQNPDEQQQQNRDNQQQDQDNQQQPEENQYDQQPQTQDNQQPLQDGQQQPELQQNQGDQQQQNEDNQQQDQNYQQQPDQNQDDQRQQDEGNQQQLQNDQQQPELQQNQGDQQQQNEDNQQQGQDYQQQPEQNQDDQQPQNQDNQQPLQDDQQQPELQQNQVDQQQNQEDQQQPQQQQYTG